MHKIFIKSALTTLLALVLATPVLVDAASTRYEVRKGDTLSGVARKTRPEGVSQSQMLAAIYRANQADFPEGSMHTLRVGQVLRIPDREEVAAVTRTNAEAAKRYREGLGYERKGNDSGALKAFLEAGESGHGLAQRKLGQIYDKGNSAVERDYQTSLKWFEKARLQGVPIAKPLVHSGKT
jgi:pilus assembly protein FimV